MMLLYISTNYNILVKIKDQRGAFTRALHVWPTNLINRSIHQFVVICLFSLSLFLFKSI